MLLHLVFFNEIFEAFLIAVAYRQGRVTDLHLSLMYRVNSVKGDDERMMDTNEFIGG